jgi:starch-binding outer membrane protein, SusD/RagB family
MHRVSTKKYKTMKSVNQKIAKISLAIALIFSASCKPEYLDVVPRGSLTADNFYKTAEHAELATNAVYNVMRRWEVSVFSYLGCTDILSDDADKGSEPNDGLFILDIDNLTFDAGNLAPLSNWDGYYRAIYRANIAIQKIPTIDMDTKLRARYVAECQFLRAYFYFNLVRWFGDVPLVTAPLSPDEFKQTRTPTADVYKQIVKDLQDALVVLPEKSQYPSADLGRVTKGAARGLLAKVYLTAKDYVNAEKYALELINSKEYDLLPDYTKIFLPEGENTSESVFEIQCTAKAERATFDAPYDGGSQFNEVQGVRGSPNLGWGFNRPSDSFILEFEPGDPRRDASILYEGEVLPDGSAIVEKNPKLFNARFNQKAWTPPHPGFNYNGPGNIRILRYSDVLLIAAEAMNENGKTATALTNLNAVRKRARGTNTNILPDVTGTDKVKIREAIWHERRVELGMEQHRWFDLVRTGQAEAAYTKHGKKFVKNKHELLPIPQKEIDLSSQLLRQNPGY